MSDSNGTVDIIFEDIRDERIAQDEKWGETNHHPLLWFSIIGEEYGEMCHAFNEYTCDDDAAHLEDMKREAVHVAASCVAMLECLARQEKNGLIPSGEQNSLKGA